MSYATQMDVLNQGGSSLLNRNNLLATFADIIFFKDAEIDCIAPPLDIFKTITNGAYDAKVTFTFQILESDRATNGIEINSVIEFDSPYAAQFGKSRLAFQVKNFQPDKKDSMVRLICNLKQ